MPTKYEVWVVAVALSVCLAGPSVAAGDFPRSSCKTWNGTVVAMSGVDTSRARMRGIITRADIQEFCDRDPGAETIPYGGKITVKQCVARYFREVRNLKLLARADCVRATLEFHDGIFPVKRVQLPLEHVDCSTGTVPLVYQFEKLCPTRARELKLNEPSPPK